MMKKIKLLILALLGITIIPTANADYEIFSSFNGNQGLLYTPYHGSILYRCPFAQNIELKEGWNFTNSNSCFASKDYNYWWATTENDTIPRPYYNGNDIQLITSIKKKDGTYTPFIVHLNRNKGNYTLDFSSGQKEYDEFFDMFYTSRTEIYSLIFRGSSGLGQVLGGVVLDGLLIQAYNRSVDYVDYSKIILYDSSSGYGYYMDLGVPLSQNLDTSFFALIDAIYNYNGDIKCWNMQQDYVSRTSLSHLSLDDNFSKNDCPSINFKEKIKNSVYYISSIFDYYKANSPYYDADSSFAVGVLPNEIASDNQTLEKYNACYSYYSSIKKYTSYDYNCYKSLLDSAPLTGSYDMVAQIKPWQDIQDWNGDGELSIQSNNPICLQLIEIKKEYKQQYAEKRDEFLKISSENFFYPHSMDIKGYCGERPKDKNFVEKVVDWVGDYWNKITGKEKIGEVDGKLVSKKEFDESLINLGLLKAKCDNPGAYMFGVPIWDHMRKLEEYRAKFCKDYNEALSGHNIKYNKIQYKSGYKELYEGSGKKVDDWGLSQIVTYFQADYNSGYSFIAGDMKSCSNPIFFKEWDFLVYVPFFIICFYIIKYMFF